MAFVFAIANFQHNTGQWYESKIMQTSLFLVSKQLQNICKKYRNSSRHPLLKLRCIPQKKLGAPHSLPNTLIKRFFKIQIPPAHSLKDFSNAENFALPEQDETKKFA